MYKNALLNHVDGNNSSTSSSSSSSSSTSLSSQLSQQYNLYQQPQQQQQQHGQQSNNNNNNNNDDNNDDNVPNNSLNRMDSNPNNLISSSITIDYDSLTDIIIEDITEAGPTSALLDFCKRKFLLPYVTILGVAGLRPITIDISSRWKGYLAHLQTLIFAILLLIGYFCQYITHFRRDRGFIITNGISNHLASYLNSSSNSTSNNNYYYKQLHFESINEILFVYTIPCVIHFFGFLSAVYIFRIAENEQIQNLVERVFILCNMPRKLFYILWLYLICGFFWLILMTIYNYFLEDTQENAIKIELFNLISFTSTSTTPTTTATTTTSSSLLSSIIIGHKFDLLIKILLSITLFCHDFLQIIVLSNYSIQCYLLRCYLFNIKDKLIQNRIEPLGWMREMTEFRKLLQYLNEKIGLPVCFFIILNMIYIFSGIIHMFSEYILNGTQIKLISFDMANIILWLTIGLFPFFQAASLTASCRSIQSSGHLIRIRPFVHHNTSAEDLNSILLYASSLNISATLFHMTIKESFLFCILLTSIVIVLAIGMSLNIYVGIT